MPTPFAHRFFLVLAAIVLAIPGTFSAAAGERPITGYRSVFIPGRDSAGSMRIAIRQYEVGPVSHFLLVDPLTLETSVVPAAALDCSCRYP
jgi:hypothetical protein